MDVKRRSDLINLVEVARELFGRLDVLVNNAGIAGLAESMTNPAVKAQILTARDKMAISPDASLLPLHSQSINLRTSM